MNADAMTKCPQCGTAIQPGALAGLCARCVMAMNLKTDTVLSGESLAAQPPVPPEQIAPHFPQLEILECLGRGGMGVVYKARQKSLNRLVALKLIAPERAGDPQFAARFEKEARALAALNHPNIVTIHDHGQAGGYYFLLMEFVDGVTLRQLLAKERVTAREALAIVPQICDALQFAHDLGIVHRDIKPENIMLDRRGRVKVADFGLAKIIGSANEENLAGGSPAHQYAALTEAGKVLGTPQYMSPEQIEAPGEVDHRADIYALGVVFYQMLTGELPGGKIEAPSKRVRIDVRLDEIVMRALETKPALRYQQASALKTQVETISESEKGEGEVPKQESAPPIYKVEEKFRPFTFAIVLGYMVSVLFCAVLAKFPGRPERGDGIDSGVEKFGAAIFLSFGSMLALALLLRYFAGQKKQRLFRRIAAVCAFVVTLPVIGFILFFLHAISQGSNDRNPRPVLFFLIFMGVSVVLLPACYMRLTRGVARRFGVGFFISAFAVGLGVIAWGTARNNQTAPVRIDPEQAVIDSKGLDNEGLVIMVGGMTDRWVPSHIDSLFAVGERVTPGRGVTWIVKRAHGNIGYHLEGPAGSMLGRIVFHPGTPAREGDGSYILGEFRPEGGNALPIAARLERAEAKLKTSDGGASDSALNNLTHAAQTNSLPLDVAVPALNAPYGSEAVGKTEPPRAKDDQERRGAVGQDNAQIKPSPQSIRTFRLRHVSASLVEENLGSVVHGRPDVTVNASTDGGSLTVAAPPDVLNRVATFILIEDWPEGAKDSPQIEALKKFFRLCAEENVEQVGKMLSIYVRLDLMGKSIERFPPENAADVEAVRLAKLGWPGREASVRDVIAAFTKYPLSGIRRDDPGRERDPAGVMTRMPVVEFENAPKPFGRMSFGDDGDGHPGINTLPPWFVSPSAAMETK